MYVTYVDYATDLTRPLSMDGFEVRPARPDDRLQEAFPRLKRYTIERWLRPDHFFYVLLREGKLAGYRCMTTTAPPAVRHFFRMRPDQLFVVMMFIRPELRRLGLGRILRLVVSRELLARGFRGDFGTESPTNYDTIVSADRRGTLRLGTLTRTCLLGWAHFALMPSTIISPEVVRRQLVLLKQVAGAISHVGLLFNPSVVRTTATTEQETRAVAAALGMVVTLLPVREAVDQAAAFAEAFSTAQAAGVDGLVVLSDPMMKDHRRAIVGLAQRHRLPALFDAEAFVRAGGLMSYGAPASCLRDFEGLNAFIETVTASGLPPPNPDDFRLVLNSQAAAEFGLRIPSALSPTAVP